MTETIIKTPAAKGVRISYGLMSTTGSVFTPKVPGAGTTESFKLLCAIHPDDPHQAKQRYICDRDDDAMPFSAGDCLKGREVDGKWVVVPPEAAKAAKISDLPERTLELSAHPFDPTTTFASGQAWIFIPDLADPFFAGMVEGLDSNGIVETEEGPQMLVGLVALKKGSEVFVRLERWGRHLVIRELIRPEDVAHIPEVEASISTKDLNMLKQLVAAQSEEFDPAAYRARVKDRVAELMRQAEEGEITIETGAKQAAPVADLSALLEASLAAAKAKAS